MLTEQLTEEGANLRDDSFVLGPGEGKAAGATLLIRVRGEDTGGAWAAVEATLPPRSGGPALHINTREEEAIYVLQGTLRVQLGDRILDASAGSIVFIPRGSVHTFCNPHDREVRFLGIISPAGFEGYFEDAAELIESTPPGTSPNIDKIRAIAESYGGVMVGPPIPTA